MITTMMIGAFGSGTTTIAFSGTRAYVGTFSSTFVNKVAICADPVGLTACTLSPYTFPNGPNTIAFPRGSAYVACGAGGLVICTDPMTLASCTSSTSFSGTRGILFSGGQAYVADSYSYVVSRCPDPLGLDLTGCQISNGAGTFNWPWGIAAYGGSIYVSNSEASTPGLVSICNATLTTCTTGGVSATSTGVRGIGFNNNLAYVTDLIGDSVVICQNPPSFTGCNTVGGFTRAIWIAFYPKLGKPPPPLTPPLCFLPHHSG